MIDLKKVVDLANDYRVNPMSMDALLSYSQKVFRMGAEHQLLNGWVEPAKALPRHLQDCMVARLVDGQVCVNHSQYCDKKHLKGFFNLDDGECFYNDDEILYWMPVNLDDVYANVMIKKGVKAATTKDTPVNVNDSESLEARQKGFLLSKPVVGQEVLVVEPQRNREPKVETRTVTKVGRKYFTLSDFNPDHTRFYIDSKNHDGDYPAGLKLYCDYECYQNELSKQKLIDSIYGVFDRYPQNAFNGASVADLEAFGKILSKVGVKYNAEY